MLEERREVVTLSCTLRTLEVKSFLTHPAQQWFLLSIRHAGPELRAEGGMHAALGKDKVGFCSDHVTDSDTKTSKDLV